MVFLVWYLGPNSIVDSLCILELGLIFLWSGSNALKAAYVFVAPLRALQDLQG